MLDTAKMRSSDETKQANGTETREEASEPSRGVVEAWMKRKPPSRGPGRRCGYSTAIGGPTTEGLLLGSVYPKGMIVKQWFTHEVPPTRAGEARRQSDGLA